MQVIVEGLTKTMSKLGKESVGLVGSLTQMMKNHPSIAKINIKFI